MPVIRKRLPPVSKKHARLVEQLVEELRKEAATGSPSSPDIVEEEQRGNHLHVTVLWDEWDDLAVEERGQIIMDAYKEARADDVLNITIAMGLTPAEAKRIGVGTH